MSLKFLKPSLKDPTIGDYQLEVSSHYHSLTNYTVKDLEYLSEEVERQAERIIFFERNRCSLLASR